MKPAIALSENDLRLKAALQRFLATNKRPPLYLRDAIRPWLEENT